MFIAQFEVGGDRNFAYLIADDQTKEAMVIDPSYSPEGINNYLNQHLFKLKYILNTHSHSDHTNGNELFNRVTGVKAIGYGDVDPFANERITDGSILYLGSLPVKIIHTPGHTEDSICILAEDALITGDTLFVGKVGGTDLGEQAKNEWDSFQNKLMKLDDHIRVFPGHDYGTKPESTIGNEKKTNPFWLQPDFESFIDLKKNWAEYKLQHGIK